MYELSFFADYWIVVMVGTLEQCQDYARKFEEWNESSNFLIEDMKNHERYYFTDDDDLELIPTAEYTEYLKKKREDNEHAKLYPLQSADQFH